MKEKVKTIMYRDHQINIYHDDDAMPPENDGNDDFFLVAYHRDFWVEREGISKELAIAIADSDYEYSEEVRKYRDKYHIFGLEAYIHSGVVLALSREGNFPDRYWDVSQLGLVFISKHYSPLAKAKEKAKRFINSWNTYLEGDVYGYMIGTPNEDEHEYECAPEDRDYPEEGGCWGFYGSDFKDLLPEAKAEIDQMCDDEKEELIQQMGNAEMVEVY